MVYLNSSNFRIYVSLRKSAYKIKGVMYILKSNGEQELFDPEKFKRSLQKIGAPSHVITDLVTQIQTLPGIQSTQDIYNYAYNYLYTVDRVLASRYNLKNALRQLGPAGFPFEQYIAQLFRAQGYTAVTNQILQGVCVTHEIDVIITRDREKVSELIECKFHALLHETINVKTPLYIQARFTDIITRNKHLFSAMWLVTNSKISISSKQYAQCVRLKLLGWGYPRNNGIERIIDQYALYPVTTLSSLTHEQKLFLIEHRILLCTDLVHNSWALAQAGLTPEQQEQVITECASLSLSTDTTSHT
jgi:hypothetical protein